MNIYTHITSSTFLVVVTFVVVVEFTKSRAHTSCNEYVCGSVVSKCLLIQSCQCELSDCFCCKDCFNCLGDLYTECCSCLDLCPQTNDTLANAAPRSQIGDFDGIAELFHTLTDMDDDRWSTVRYPIRRSEVKYHSNKVQLQSNNLDLDTVPQKTPISANCTVIFLNTCQTTGKCQQFCESMGASRYRWFHDGCCECIGKECINYGLNESRCSECPQTEEKDDQAAADEMDFQNEDMWDFGEEEHNYN